MSKPLKLIALASKLDHQWAPPLEQVSIFITGLSHICDLEKPENLPERGFAIKPCPKRDIEDIDEGIREKGIDFLGLYSSTPASVEITLFMCRIRRFAARYGFHFEDVIKITLIHELAHFVTHLGRSVDPECWVAFGNAEPKHVETTAQQATHLYLRVAGYGQLVQVFDSVSHHCPEIYNDWREKWEKQTRTSGLRALGSNSNFGAAIKGFRSELIEERKKEHVLEPENIHKVYNYDE